MIRRSIFVLSLFWIGFSSVGESAVSSRDLTSLSFPKVRTTSDSDDILDTYSAYLRFVVDIGKELDPKSTRELQSKYELLKRTNPVAAARFLRGLRFELLQKLELMGLSVDQVSTRTPRFRLWVRKYIKEWAREADENLFRARTGGPELADRQQ